MGEDYKPSISIIIPIYNAEKEISRCMESIYAQTFNDYEVILVNDGSNDNSAVVCRKYAENNDRVTFINKENGGSGSARNAGIDVAKGKYIYFCDADDEIDKKLLERVCNEAEYTHSDLVVFSVGARIINSKTQKIINEYTTTKKKLLIKTKKEFEDNFSKLYYEGVLFGGPVNKLFKTSVIRENNVRFPDLKRGQDEVFNIRYYRFVSSCSVIPDTLYTYYQFDSKGKNKKYRLNYFETTTRTYFNELSKLLKEFGADDEYTKKKFQNSFVYSMEASILLAWNPLEKLNKKSKIDFIKRVLDTDFVVMIAKEVALIPEQYEKFWQFFISRDAESLYKYINGNIKVEKIKKPLRRIKYTLLSKR